LGLPGNLVEAHKATAQGRWLEEEQRGFSSLFGDPADGLDIWISTISASCQ
jgi:hypothetical protein